MEWLLGYLVIGAIVGFFAGLLGIGGGAIMVPLLVIIFEAQNLPNEHVLHLAVGTAMSTILFTALSSIRAHAKRGSLRWDIPLALTPGIVVGGLAGSLFAGAISTFTLAVGFCVIIYIAGINILLDRNPKPGRELPGALGLNFAGFIFGAVSSLVALGGAFMTVPFMLYCNVPMRAAVGAAAVIGIPIALAGSVGYLYSGWSQQNLPSWSFGYIYLPAMLGIVISSVLIAPLGAAAAHKWPVKWLKRIFGVLLLVFATRMVWSLS